MPEFEAAGLDYRVATLAEERRATEAQARSLDAQTRSLETPLERAAPKREGDR